ncbi:uncharacterized protein F4807DRAFT_456963 [Annulohypoxylon truncatum]|uniref:uncharacterized protein n=1 Tax=Annulohypoxylon truncatum TaxID=327061 RepID=UPI002008CABD|nr:uncharacterized protein F4807DRAFT_456963 [Annulohypoxylon truncatum]KAI1212879.1 hypothetical protein F4807DRAFT_456963 [Annulohypoxylon truncatum]
MSQALPVLIEQDNIRRHLQRLQDIADASNGSRMAGSVGHNRTIEYIKDELRNLGYYVETQKVEAMMPVNSDAVLSVNGDHFPADPIGWSPSVTLIQHRLVVVAEDGCNLWDYPFESMGAIVLVNGDGCSFSLKSRYAQVVGADALIIYEDAQLIPNLGQQSRFNVPSVRISQTALRDIMNLEPPLYVDLFRVSSELQWECGDDEKTLLVGTHTDSVDESAGMNDNAGGIASLLEVAAQVTKFKTKSRVKFAFWTAAEPCLIGSKYFVQNAYPEELRKIRLYLDANMLGSPNGALKIYDGSGTSFRHESVAPLGSKDAQATLVNGFEAQGAESIMSTRITNRSDYATFFDAHIPFAGLFSGADGLKTEKEEELFGGRAGYPYDENYHQPEDDITNINMTTLFLNTKALAHAVGTYGRSFDEFTALTMSAAWRYTTTARYSTLITQAWVTYSFLAYAL